MANPTNATNTLMPTRRKDVSRFDSIMLALGACRQKRTPRIDTISYVLEHFEKNPPKEVSRFLKPASADAGKRQP